MSKLYSLIKACFPTVSARPDRDEAYLAASVDMQDLELRIRALDHRGRRLPPGLLFGCNA